MESREIENRIEWIHQRKALDDMQKSYIRFQMIEQTQPLKDEIAELKGKLNDRLHECQQYAFDECLLKSRIDELEKGNEWISVEDRLPEIGYRFNLFSDDVLVYTKDEDYKTAYYDYNINDWILMSGIVTYWMPLPNKPKTN